MYIGTKSFYFGLVEGLFIIDNKTNFQFQIDIVTTDTIDAITHGSASSGMEGVGESSKGQTVLLLRMGPHRVDNAPDILADCPIDHPFFVKDKGKFM